MLTIALTVLLALPSDLAQEFPPPKWATPEVRSNWAKSVPISAYRKRLQELKFEVDVLDLKKVRGLFDEAFGDWRKDKSNKNRFKLLCLAAYFPPIRGEVWKVDEHNIVRLCARDPGDYDDIEYAFVATCAFAADRMDKLGLDLLDVFLERAAGDPLVPDLCYNLLGSYPGVPAQLKGAIDVTKRVATRFPLRDEYWQLRLFTLHWTLWSRTGKGQDYRPEAIQYAKAVLGHPQSNDRSKESVARLLKELEGG